MLNEDCGISKPIQTGTGRREPSAYSDSSANHRSQTSESSQLNSQQSSTSEEGRDAGAEAELKHRNCDELLSWLQTLIGELIDRGVDVKLFQNQDMLKVGLKGVRFCRTHKMIHAGESCPICR